MSSILRKLSVNDRTQAVVYAMRQAGSGCPRTDRQPWPSPERDSSPATSTSGNAGDLATRLSAEVASLDNELTEIAMLVAQAQSEATRHEQRRIQTTRSSSPDEPAGGRRRRPQHAAGIADPAGGGHGSPGRCARGQAQRRSPGSATACSRSPETYGGIQAADVASAPGGAARLSTGDGAELAMSRIVLNAQEDLRREIAGRCTTGRPEPDEHRPAGPDRGAARRTGPGGRARRGAPPRLDGPADPRRDETFIFDVRPMVLDDLGLVPTLRRAARERGRRAGIAVEFDSVGADRRIAVISRAASSGSSTRR